MVLIPGMIDREELARIGRFALIGVLNTGVHLAVVISLVELLHVFPVWANGAAFVCANLFSFWANSRWSFKRRMSRARYIRFLSVSLLSLFATLGLTSLGEMLNLYYLVSVFVTMFTLPAVTYLAHRLWTFK